MIVQYVSGEESPNCLLCCFLILVQHAVFTHEGAVFFSQMQEDLIDFTMESGHDIMFINFCLATFHLGVPWADRLNILPVLNGPGDLDLASTPYGTPYEAFIIWNKVWATYPSDHPPENHYTIIILKHGSWWDVATSVHPLGARPPQRIEAISEHLFGDDRNACRISSMFFFDHVSPTDTVIYGVPGRFDTAPYFYTAERFELCPIPLATAGNRHLPLLKSVLTLPNATPGNN